MSFVPMPAGRNAQWKSFRRGQGAVEFLVVAALVTTIAAVMVVPAVREAEASMALSAARAGAFNAALLEKADLTSMEFSQAKGGQYDITPAVSVGGNPVPVSDAMKKAMVESMARTLSPSSRPDGNCVKGIFAKYCASG